MLTLKQISDISFRKSGFSGYKPEDVDDFIDEVTESYTALLKENQAFKAKAAELATKNSEMREKMVVLAQKIESYRDDEEGIKNALLSAQKLGAASIKDAKKKAEAIVAEATAKANDILEEAKSKSVDIVSSYEVKIMQKEKEFDTLKASVTSFRSSLYDMYRTHLSAIEKIPDFSAELSEGSKKVIPEITEEKPVEPKQESVVAEPKPIPVKETPKKEEVTNIDIKDTETDSDDSDKTRTFGDIDLNAFADIPESLKKEKASLYSTLEFGDDIDFKK